MIKGLSKGIGIFIALLFILGSFAPVFAVQEAAPQALLYGKYAVGDEVIELRTENSKTKWLGGNRYSAEISIGAIHYKDDYKNNNELWKDIDLTWQNNTISKAPYILTVNPNNYSLTMYDKKTGSTASLALSTIGGKAVPKAAKAGAKNAVTFNNVATDLDIEIVAGNTRVQFKRILKSNKAPAEAVFGLSQTGTGIVVTSEARYVDSAGMLDAKIPVIASKTGGLLTETIDKSKVVKYPIEIDPTLTVYPGVTAVDGLVQHGYSVGGGQAWATIIAAAGSYSRSNGNPDYSTWIRSDSGTNKWLEYTRGIYLFDTSELPDNAVISAATLSLYGTAKADALNITPNVNIYSSNPASNTALANADYATLGSTPFCDTPITYANWSITGYNNFALNAAGIAAISKTNVSKFGTRNANYDVAAQAPTWSNGGYIISSLSNYMSEQGAGYQPKLVIDYTLPAPTVTTSAASSIEATTATLNGSIDNLNGGSNCTRHGFGWDVHTHTNWNDYANDVGTNGDFGVGNYTDAATGLPAGTTIYCRAYATNDLGTGQGAEVTFLTKPAAPTNVAATDGTQTTKVVITWTKSTGATDYQVYRNGNALGWAGDVATFDDTGADAPVITPGAADASDGTSAAHVTLTLSGHSASNGTTHTYKVRAKNATGESADSATDTGYRGTTTLTYQWQRTTADADNPADYGNIGGGTTNPYNDTGAPADGSGRYFRCVVSMSGAASQTSATDRGYRAVAPTVTTGLCTGFGTTWAIVNGTIGSFGLPANVTQIGFDYGTTIGYGSEVTQSGTYATGVNYSLTIPNLNPATLYHYRFKAYNGAWGYGADAAFATEGSATLHEYLSTGSDNCTVDIYGGNWEYQTFTTTQSHTVAFVKLYLQRTGNPGTVTVGIRRTSGGFPTGNDLGTVTYNGNNLGTLPSWYGFDFSPEISLEDATMYAIVVRATAGDNSNDVQWCLKNAGGIAVGEPGNAGHSADSGFSWAAAATRDHLFEVWGYSTLQIHGAKVFKNYLSPTAGDWLITCLYTNVYPPYYDNRDDVSLLFVLQLANASGTVLAQSKVQEWGYKPGAIYLRSSMVTALEWGASYKVRMTYVDAPTVYAEYAFVGADWLGSDLTRLDAEVLRMAFLMEDYYGESFTTYVAGKGRIFNEDGGALFATCIPALSDIRPHLFQVTSTGMTHVDTTDTNALQVATVWQAKVGPAAVALLTSFGNILNVSGSTVGAVFFFLAYVVVAGWGFAKGHTLAGFAITMPLAFAAAWLGFIPYSGVMVLVGISILLLVWQMLWKNA